MPMISSTPEHPVHPPVAVDRAGVAALETIDHAGLDWGRVSGSTYLIHHELRYVYPGPITDLRHKLMIVPPPQLGDQRRIMHRIEVTGAEHTLTERADRFGNLVAEIAADRVEAAVGFEAWAVVQRCTGCPPAGIAADRAGRLGLLTPTTLTMPDDAILEAAATLTGGRSLRWGSDRAGALALAERIADFTARHFTYRFGVTSVATTAAEAMAGRIGVCQDYSHVMLALCRAAGLPARYVSGHLLGEGGTHAWVEVLVPHPDQPGRLVAEGFDPTNDRRVGLVHVPVVVGRDYADVAPTSGSFEAGYQGRLESSKRVGVTAVEYSAA
jgi:transglutaminase-like putative cysteine protease